MINHISGAVTFEAGEDLMNESKTQIVIFRGTTKSIELSNPRSFLSYSQEYCGLTGLSYHTIRFQIMGRDIKPETMISDSVDVTITHKAEFAIEPPNSLKSSMKSLLMGGLYSDLNLKLSSKVPVMKVHRCILYMRSKPLRILIEELEKSKDYNPKDVCEIDISKDLGEDEGRREAFISVIGFLYSGEIVFPKNPLDVVTLLQLAKEYKVEDLEEICEDEIVKKIDATNILEILLLFEQKIKVSEETSYRVKSFFLKNFDHISTLYPDIEEQLAKCPGLTKKLFLHISGKNKKFKRKVTFVVDYDINMDTHDM